MKNSLGSNIKVRTMVEDPIDSGVQRLREDRRRVREAGTSPRCYNCGELGHVRLQWVTRK